MAKLEAEWVDRFNYMVEYSKENYSLPTTDWCHYSWMASLKRYINKGKVSKEKIDYIERMFPLFIGGGNISNINKILKEELETKRLEQGVIPIEVVFGKVKSSISTLYDEVKDKRIATVEDALDLLKSNAYMNKRVDFTKFEYLLLCTKYPYFYKNTYAEFKRFSLLYELFQGSFYKFIFSEVNTTDKEGEYDLAYLNYAILYGMAGIWGRDSSALCAYYGVSTDKKISFTELSKEYSVTKDRMRNVVLEGVRRLRHPSRCFLKIILSDRSASSLDFEPKCSRLRLSESDLFEKCNSVLKLQGYYGKLPDCYILEEIRKLLGTGVLVEKPKKVTINGGKGTFVSSLESRQVLRSRLIKEHKGLDSGIEVIVDDIRTYNILKRQGVHTIKDMISFADSGEEKLNNIRGLGEKSKELIYSYLYEIGYSLDEETGRLVDDLA